MPGRFLLEDGSVLLLEDGASALLLEGDADYFATDLISTADEGPSEPDPGQSTEGDI